MAVAVLLLLVLAMAAAAHGATHTVGAPSGSWDLRTNYTAWASSRKFQTGDKLRFVYPAGVHNVVEVGKAGYDACNGSKPVSTFRTGEDVVRLASAGTRYYICGVAGHCAAGMKLKVVVKAQPKTYICRGSGNRRRCSWVSMPTTTTSSATRCADESTMVVIWSATAVAAIGMLFF